MFPTQFPSWSPGSVSATNSTELEAALNAAFERAYLEPQIPEGWTQADALVDFQPESLYVNPQSDARRFKKYILDEKRFVYLGETAYTLWEGLGFAPALGANAGSSLESQLGYVGVLRSEAVRDQLPVVGSLDTLLTTLPVLNTGGDLENMSDPQLRSPKLAQIPAFEICGPDFFGKLESYPSDDVAHPSGTFVRCNVRGRFIPPRCQDLSGASTIDVNFNTIKSHCREIFGMSPGTAGGVLEAVVTGLQLDVVVKYLGTDATDYYEKLRRLQVLVCCCVWCLGFFHWCSAGGSSFHEYEAIISVQFFPWPRFLLSGRAPTSSSHTQLKLLLVQQQLRYAPLKSVSHHSPTNVVHIRSVCELHSLVNGATPILIPSFVPVMGRRATYTLFIHSGPQVQRHGGGSSSPVLQNPDHFLVFWAGRGTTHQQTALKHPGLAKLFAAPFTLDPTGNAECAIDTRQWPGEKGWGLPCTGNSHIGARTISAGMLTRLLSQRAAVRNPVVYRLLLQLKLDETALGTMFRQLPTTTATGAAAPAPPTVYPSNVYHRIACNFLRGSLAAIRIPPTPPPLYCPPGLFDDRKNETHCQPTRPGFFQSDPGQTEELPCPSGTYCREFSCQTCAPCPAGHYQPDPGQGKCLPAPPGHFVAKQGQRKTIPCPRGFFANDTGRSECEACKPGSYAPRNGQSECTLCPAGFFAADWRRFTPCTACPPGQQQLQRGNAFCFVCVVGTFKRWRGPGACTRCPDGMVTEGPGARNGMFFDCVCPAGFWKDDRGISPRQHQCRPCPIGLDCPRGSAWSGFAMKRGEVRNTTEEEREWRLEYLRNADAAVLASANADSNVDSAPVAAEGAGTGDSNSMVNDTDGDGAEFGGNSSDGNSTLGGKWSIQEPPPGIRTEFSPFWLF